MTDTPAVVFWGIIYGAHDKDGQRIVPTLRNRKKMAALFGVPWEMAYWRKWVEARP